MCKHITKITIWDLIPEILPDYLKYLIEGAERDSFVCSMAVIYTEIKTGLWGLRHRQTLY